MFTDARLKLTMWYLLILMTVSGVFSITIYRGANFELTRMERRQQVQIQLFRDRFLFNSDFPVMFTPEPIDEIRQKLKATLLAINAGILLVSGLLGYVLAGRTLRPISDMVEEQNRFITDASHELRTPITAIKTEIEVGLRDKKLSLTDARNLLKSNLEETNTLQTISDKLLSLTQLQKPVSLSFTIIPLKTVIDDAIKKIAPMAKKKNIEIFTQIKETGLVAQKERLTEALVILLDNAIKYSKSKTKIVLDAKRVEHSIVISVKDQGIGIDNSDLPHIFDRFYRVEKSRSKDSIPGYGLGLSIAKKIISEHNGTILAKSTIGKGTTFLIRIPANRHK